MPIGKPANLRWAAKKYLPKKVTDLLRAILPESIYYPGYGRTTLSSEKLDHLVQLLEGCLSRQLEGDLIECGVFRGGSLVVIGQVAQAMQPRKRVFGADTFAGHPFDSPEDVPADHLLVHHKGLFSANNHERVLQTLRRGGVSNVSLLKGRLEDTLSALGDNKFCFAHLDLDLYLSTKQALAFIEPRLVPGGTIVFDDYGGGDTPGVTRAVAELLPHARITLTKLEPGEGTQGYWIKP